MYVSEWRDGERAGDDDVTGTVGLMAISQYSVSFLSLKIGPDKEWMNQRSDCEAGDIVLVNLPNGCHRVGVQR